MNKQKNNRKIIVGVSGGIDSAAALLMLKEQGFDVVAVYLMMHHSVLEPSTAAELKELSLQTGVEVKCVDVSSRFRSMIVDPYREACLKGVMLSPCTICNPLIKWHSLLEYADKVGAYYVATGHYCCIEHNDLGIYNIVRGADKLKDQSYYMWRLTQSMIKRIIFPLGKLTKKEVRNFMSKKGWVDITNKSESMGVCFFRGLKFAQWLEKEGVQIPQGDVISPSGSVVGQHKGYAYYTLAQKKGFTVTDDSYRGKSVISIDCYTNTLTLGDPCELMSTTLIINDTVFTSLDEALNSTEISVMVRGVGFNPEGYVSITKNKNKGEYTVSISGGEAWAVTKGQPAVFYIKDRLIGGGTVIDYYP